MNLFNALVSKARAAETGGFKEVWELYQFLDETPGVEIYDSVGLELEQQAKNLTDEQKDEMRQLGVAFPEDLDNVPALMVQQPPWCSGCGTNHWPHQDCFHNGLY